MAAVVRNTFVQGTLSILFVTLALVVIVAAVLAAWTSISTGGRPDHEEEPVPSRLYAPAGLVATPAEKELEKEWTETAGTPARSGH